MKPVRAIAYYGSLSWGFLRMFPSLVAEAMLLRFWPHEVKKGIRIVDPLAETRAGFVAAIDEALTLIEANDPMRFARLKREVRAIVAVPVLGGAEYCRFLRSCHIDLRAYPLASDRESAITLLACRLIHETTHGHLCTKRVLQQKHYPEVERLCAREEARFARKVGVDLPESWWSVPDDAQPQVEERRDFAKTEMMRLRQSLRERSHEGD